MAQGSNKRTTSSSRGKRSSTGRKTTKAGTGTKRKSAEEHYDIEMKREILLLVVFAVSALTALSNFGLCGAFGDFISKIMFGIFGITAYVFPFYLFFSIAFLVSNAYSRKAVIKYIATIILYLLVCMVLEMMFHPFSSEAGLLFYYKNASETHVGGGLMGGMLVKLMRPTLGVVGSYIIAIAGMIVSIVLITERSVINGVKTGGSRVYQSAKEDAQRMREASRIRNEEKKLERQIEKQQRVDKKVKGVTLAEIAKPEKAAADIHEITMEYKETDIFAGNIEEAEPPRTFTEEPALQAFVTEVPAELSGEEETETGRSEHMAEPVELNPAYASAKLPEIEETAEQDKKEETKLAEEVVDYTVDLSGVMEEEGTKAVVPPPYKLPPLSLLKRGKNEAGGGSQKKEMQETAKKLEATLQSFGVGVAVTNVSCGPSVTRYELQPEQGVKVSKIVSLADDIKLNLAAADIRIEAPIPGKAAVGIEVPNKENMTVMLRDLLETQEFQKHSSRVAFAVGKDIGGQTIVTDIAKMPHLLIAGATGSGKSVCINTLIMSILYKANPNDVKLIMVDPKVVELSVYNGIPHLMIPVVTDPKKAAGALNWAVAEMTDRYNKFSEFNVRDLKGYNEKIDSIAKVEGENKPQKMPQIIIIVDELADLMMVAAGEVEDAICRLAQLARAAGIHLVIATQRPSVNVITGLIKANVPSRIAFSVSSGVDSRTIIDMNGAEKLLGKGDMLFFPAGYPKPVRVQGAFVSDKEVGAVVDFLSKQMETVQYNQEVDTKITNAVIAETAATGGASDQDEHFAEAGRFIIEKEKASIGMLQRMFKIGFNRAARIMEQLSHAGVVGPEEGTKPRKILMTMEEFETYLSNNGNP